MGRHAAAAGSPELTAVEHHQLDDPLEGWRYWQLHPSTGLLRSVTHRGVTWRAGQPMRAVCMNGGHEAPAPGCACGIHAAPTLERLREDSLCLRPGEALVVGQVALWGAVVRDDHGLRAERGYPRRLWVVAPPGGGGDALAAYGVPVGTMPPDEAVGEVAAAILAFQSMSG
ncbi:MAG TPA: hypothetical protein VFJ85_04875 [Acidimicrobiales bacterium]|nr:hypothetical protein [Acidimicrobiales bacterium]